MITLETATRPFSNFREMQLRFAYTTKTFCFPLHSAPCLLAPLLTARLKHSNCEMQHDTHTPQKQQKRKNLVNEQLPINIVAYLSFF